LTDHPHSRIIITAFLTILALTAFAANSVLCRLALGEDMIDPAGFTSVRLLSGATVLLFIASFREKSPSRPKGGWASSVALFVYAVSFSFAYLTLDTGTGALILFGSVQTTMVLWSMFFGERTHPTELIGIAIAFAGFVYLVIPGLSTPSLTGFLLMSVAGMSWGIYTIRGRGSHAPLLDTSYNFARTIPLVFILVIFSLKDLHYSATGIWLAILSGAIASGIGYTIWYGALPYLSTTRAAVVQLAVPVIAAAGGVIFVGETITPRLALASLLILGGILMVISGRYFIVSKASRSDRSA